MNDYLSVYKNDIDSLILGCTHYPIVLNQIMEVLGDKTYISSSHAISQEVYSYLKVHNQLNTCSKSIDSNIYNRRCS